MKLVLASGNRGKLAELADMLDGLGFDLVLQSALGIDDADETGASFIENAILKARHAARRSGLPALGDDSGLCVDALGGAPGLYSARYAGTHGDDAANRAKLLDALAGIDDAGRGAHFHCAVALLRSAEDPTPLVVEGRWHGHVAHAPRGDRGFGYDPLFVDAHSGLTAAELDPAEKNRLSHRGRALARLRECLDAKR